MSRRRRTSLAYRKPTKPTKTAAAVYILFAAVCIAGLFLAKQNLTKPVTGRVLDAYTNAPLAGVSVVITGDRKLTKTAGISETQQAFTDNTGTFTIPQSVESFNLAAQQKNYRPLEYRAAGVMTLEIRLAPDFVRGKVSDAAGTPIPRAIVGLGDRTTETDSLGNYTFAGDVADEGTISVRAAGFRRTSKNYSKTTQLDFQLETFQIRGVYFAPPDVAAPNNLRRLVDNLNPNVTAVVLDLKDERGRVLYDSKVSLTTQTVANADRKIANLPEALKSFDDKKLYSIGRIVMFQDPVLTDLKPEWTLKSKTTGKPWTDRTGFNWINPYNRDAWEYYLGIAEEAARAGFDEIQFVGLHFPVMGSLTDIEYALPAGRTSNAETRMETINGFLKAARSRLAPLGVYISISVFGTALIEGNDLGIGMDVRQLVQNVDYISPVLYPAEWGAGAFGIDNPVAKPGELVRQAMLSAQSVFIDRLIQVRPWLQDFAPSGVTFGAAQVQEQIRAVEEFQKTRGAGWLLYNPASRYTLPAN